MKSPLHDHFDKIICINLLERTDKKEMMLKKFNDLSIDVEWYHPIQYSFIPNIINGINSSGKAHFNQHQPYEIGASLSHYYVIKQALLEGCEKIFVFEDDILFQKDFNNKFQSYWKSLPENWDMILLYSFMYNLQPQNVRVSSRWIKAFNSWSLMSYGMNKLAMEEYIKRQDNYFTIADMVTYKMQEETNLNMYTSIPSLCVPATNFESNIRGNNMNYKNNPTVINLGFGEDNYE